MPSIESIANEVKALVSDIKAETISIRNNTNTIKNDAAAIRANTDTLITRVDQLDTDVKTGFINLSQGLQVLIALGQQQNQLAAENNKQNETIICWLTNIANTLCEVKRNTDREVELQTDISATLHHMDDIGELVNAREAVEVANRYELEERLAECCPPKEEPERPCFEPCASPRPTRFEPVRVDWKPVKYDRQDVPG